jgi:hypothetical protein
MTEQSLAPVMVPPAILRVPLVPRKAAHHPQVDLMEVLRFQYLVGFEDAEADLVLPRLLSISME